MRMTRTTQCCIAGGGPAGMMLGFLLARAGVDVVVLEKHADFFRDFRGDTIHPSTLDLMYELGLLDAFLALPHQEARRLGVSIGDTMLELADFAHLPTHCKFLAFMPQWDFLNFLAAQAKRFPSFHLEMNASAEDLILDGARVAGLRVRSANGALEIAAPLTIGADGRSSTVRERAGFEVIDVGAPIDVLWFHLSRREGDPAQTLGRLERGDFLIMIDRADYYQCGFVIPKGGFDDLKRAGLDAFFERIVRVAPFVAGRRAELKSWDDVSLLTVKVDRLRRWHREGLLCIGDAAHAMSPVGGVGINLAIQDAVATANILVPAFARGRVSDADLAALQRRREFPARATQAVQVLIQNAFLKRVLSGTKPLHPNPLLRFFASVPLFRRIPAYAIGVGVRPEHIRTSAVAP